MAKEWDRENMRTLATNVKRETAEAFRRYAEERGTTVGALLRGFVEASVAAPRAVQTELLDGVMHLVSYRNTDLLKAEDAISGV